jgi:hypothetical protein
MDNYTQRTSPIAPMWAIGVPDRPAEKKDVTVK